MNEFKISTTMELNEDDEGSVQIVFRIKGFPSKTLAGLYAAQLMAIRDATMHDGDDEYNIQGSTLH
jgi:hypothetical protein